MARKADEIGASERRGSSRRARTHHRQRSRSRHRRGSASFLRFVVETTLAGRGDRLKGYTIGVEALGRREDFDPQIDPIVRVEAGRLRAALARYYAGPGRNEPVVIELPRGAYRARFSAAGTFLWD